MVVEHRECPAHSGLIADIDTLKIDNEKQWIVIDKLRNRLPLWATLVISMLMFFLGLTIGYAEFVAKIKL